MEATVAVDKEKKNHQVAPDQLTTVPTMEQETEQKSLQLRNLPLRSQQKFPNADFI